MSALQYGTRTSDVPSTAKAAMDVPRAPENPYLLMVQAVSDYAIFMLDPEGRVLTWNRGSEHILGYQAEEVIGRHCETFYPPESVAALMPDWEMEVAEEQGRHDHEDWRIRKDGSRIWTSITTTRLLTAEGSLIGFGKMIRDLSAKRAVENDLLQHKVVLSSQLESAYKQLRSITNSVVDGILEIGPDWKVLFGNNAAVQSLPDFQLGKTVWECFPDLLGTPAEHHMRTAMAERSRIAYENYYPAYDMWFNVRLSPTENGLAVIYTDSTRERKLQDQLNLEQALREKRIEALSHMAGGLAHEINNPLAIIRAMAGDLHDTMTTHNAPPTQDMRESCESILLMADRATRILKGLRGFAREAGRDPKEWASVYDIVSECVDMQQTRFERHEVILNPALDDNLPPLLCRATQIGQILTNLLNNSLDAIVQSESFERLVTISASQRDGSLIIRVTDTGPGVDKQYRAHLMEPFFTTKVGDLGMGIGLSLSRAIAEDHGGLLALMEDEPQTCFQLTLPLNPDPETSPVASESIEVAA